MVSKKKKIDIDINIKAVFTWYWVEFHSGTIVPRFHSEAPNSFTWSALKYVFGTSHSGMSSFR